MSDTTAPLIGDLHAPKYDQLFDHDDNEQVAALLHSFAAGGTAMELGVGTGRFAVPLARLGTPVIAVDNSTAMLEQLGSKITDEPITAVQDDIVTVKPGKDISFIYCVFSTLFMLENQKRQVQCICNAAEQLPPGGQLLLDMFVHDRTRFVNNQETVTLDVEVDHAAVRVATLEPNTQILKTQRIELRDGGFEVIPNRLRFIYPSELDLMARIAGLEPVAKWSSWGQDPFTATSTNLVALYRKPGTTSGG